jgi:hypothetical protein
VIDDSFIACHNNMSIVLGPQTIESIKMIKLSFEDKIIYFRAEDVLTIEYTSAPSDEDSCVIITLRDARASVLTMKGSNEMLWGVLLSKLETAFGIED